MMACFDDRGERARRAEEIHGGIPGWMERVELEKRINVTFECLNNHCIGLLGGV